MSVSTFQSLFTLAANAKKKNIKQKSIEIRCLNWTIIVNKLALGLMCWTGFLNSFYLLCISEETNKPDCSTIAQKMVTSKTWKKFSWYFHGNCATYNGYSDAKHISTSHVTKPSHLRILYSSKITNSVSYSLSIAKWW